MSYVLTNRALDINMSEKELCYCLGYLARSGRIKYIEAQVPYGKEDMFERAYPGQKYDKMKPTSDKQSFQFRIMLNYTGQCPEPLEKALTVGCGSANNNCISRGKFIEKIINEYGFKFSYTQDVENIRRIVANKHPNYVNEFDKGYNVALNY